ncbi:MAG: glutathione S-transferase [Pontixanthobacter sp.]
MPDPVRHDVPILYSFRRCPYAMRARMALHINGTKVETREVVLRDKPAAMLEASPKGTVPVLVLPGDTVVDESIDIMRWALARNDPEDWLAGDDRDLIARIDGPFKHHLDRYKYETRYDSDSEAHRKDAHAILKDLDAQLAGSAFLRGEGRSMADVATFPFIRQFANADREWFDACDLPHLQRWLAGLLASDLFAAIMAKRPRWQPGSMTAGTAA